MLGVIFYTVKIMQASESGAYVALVKSAVVLVNKSTHWLDPLAGWWEESSFWINKSASGPRSWVCVYFSCKWSLDLHRRRKCKAPAIIFLMLTGQVTQIVDGIKFSRVLRLMKRDLWSEERRLSLSVKCQHVL